jgi:hypothetical protein
MSPLITRDQYSACIHAGRYSPPANWGRCEGERDQPVNCVHVQQALSYAAWSGGWLPDQREWAHWLQRLIEEAQGIDQSDKTYYSSGSMYEWVVPSDSSEVSSKWRESLLRSSYRDLKVGRPIEVRRVALGAAASSLSRRSPLAFQVPDLSFRVVYPHQRCLALMR